MNEDKRCSVCNREFRTEHDFLTRTSRWRLCTQGNLWFNCACGSTLVIKKDKFSWYSPEKSLGAEARSVFNQLGNLKDLPHVPAIALEIQQMLQDPNVMPQKIARDIRREPVIATQVLQIAENIRNARSPGTSRFKALEHAIVYIGIKALSDLVITSALRGIALPESKFSSDTFWKESYLIGAVSEFLMRRYAPQLNPDEAFLAGSLCNIGKLVMAFCFPPLVSKILVDVEGDQKTLVTWRQAEASYAFPDHCVLGEIAATLWGFPGEIVDAGRRHHTFAPKPAAELTLFEIVAAANQMSHWVLSRPHRVEYQIIEGFRARVRLSDAGLEALANELGLLRTNIARDAVAA